jgi:aminocarboxymuconate-semialdehyde decarboxylase
VPFSRITLTDIRIDVHAHYWTDAYLDMLVELGRCDTATQRGIGAGSGSELDLRRRLMDRAGVDIQVLSAAPQLPYSEENADGADAAARYVNDRPRVATSGSVRAFAATPMPHIDAAIAEMSGAIDELGKVGVTMNTSILYLHPVGNRGRSPLVSEHRITWMVGAPFEDTIAAMQLITSGHLQRYPAVKIICSHLGGPRPVIPPSRRRRRRMGDDRHSATAQPGCASTLGLHRKPLPTVRQCDAPSTHSSGRWPTSTRRPIPATRTPYWSERHGSVRHSRLGRLALALGVAQAYPEPGGLADRFLDRPWFPT